jgi:zinc D-Ala-D-Ala carboxypeptidase
MDIGPNDRLSRDFLLREFLYSETAERAGRAIVPPPEVVANLRMLCVELLQPLRNYIGRPFMITSGYRPDWLNRMIGGSLTSAHMYGLAADVKVVGLTPLEFSRAAQGYSAPFDQVIYEGSWTHLAVAPVGAAPRGQVLTAHFGRRGVTYSSGLA